MTAPNSNPFRRSPWLYPFLACFLLFILFSAKQINDFDLGFHLRTGQWILVNHAIPQKDLYTYTVPQHDYVDMEWLYEVGLFCAYKWFGYPALTVLNIVLVFLAFGLVFARMKVGGAAPWLYPFLGLWTLVAVEPRFIVRPEVLTWVLLALQLYLLDLWWKGKKDLLFLLPVIQLLWVNTEGIFILGWVVMGAYLAGGWKRDKRVDPKLLQYTLAACAVCLLNPYFFKGLTFPFVLFTRTEGSNLFKQLIYEFQSPWATGSGQDQPFAATTALMAYKAFSLFSLSAVLLTLRRRSVHELLLLGAFFYLSAVGMRNIPLFFIVALPIAAAATGDLLEAGKGILPKAWIFRLPPWLVPGCLTLAILALGTRVATNAYYVTDRRHDCFGLDLDREVLPVDSVEFLKRNGLDGRLLNHFNFGGWLDWAGPSPVFIDGRSEVIQEGLFGEFVQSVQPMGLEAMVSKYGIQLILNNPRAGSPWTEQLRTLGDWRLVYWDESSALYARSGYAPSLPAIRLEDVLSERGVPQATDAWVTQNLTVPAPSGFQIFSQGFYRPQKFPFGLMNMGVFAYQNGQWETAQRLFLEGLRETNGCFPDIYANLGAALVKGGRLGLAKLCYEKILILQPGNAQAAHILNQLNTIHG